jgi:hypothetical protein
MTEYERQLIKNQIVVLEKKIKLLEESFDKPVAWARINGRGDLFDLRTQNNPYIDQNTVVPLYRKNHE